MYVRRVFQFGHERRNKNVESCKTIEHPQFRACSIEHPQFRASSSQLQNLLNCQLRARPQLMPSIKRKPNLVILPSGSQSWALLLLCQTLRSAINCVLNLGANSVSAVGLRVIVLGQWMNRKVEIWTLEVWWVYVGPSKLKKSWPS